MSTAVEERKEVDTEIRRGWWREGSYIDDLDKRISSAVFALELGLVAELLLSMPATWLGIPISAFTLSNILTYIAMLEEDEALEMLDQQHWLSAQMQTWAFALHAHNFLLLSSICLLAWSTFFFRHLWADNIVVVYLANKRGMLPSMFLPVWMGGAFSQTAYRASTFFIVSWLCAQMVSSTLKLAFGRIRPMVAANSRHSIAKVKRNFTTITTMLSVGESVFESFPSGDTVGSAVFGATLHLLQVQGAPLIGLITAFCRMYFHAHHLLDVLAGFCIGWTVPIALNAAGFGLKYFDAWKTIAVVIVALIYFIQLHKFKPELPAHLRAGSERKGF